MGNSSDLVLHLGSDGTQPIQSNSTVKILWDLTRVKVLIDREGC